MFSICNMTLVLLNVLRGRAWKKHFLNVTSIFRLAVLGKLNNFVKEWIAEISELKVCHVHSSLITGV